MSQFFIVKKQNANMRTENKFEIYEIFHFIYFFDIPNRRKYVAVKLLQKQYVKS